MLRRLLIAAFVLTSPLSAQLCTARRLSGEYGMQLTGMARISGQEAPLADFANLTVADDGSVSGYSSVNFNGVLLGNPVTGTIELHPDCSVALALQDDSGAFQHFSGIATPDLSRIDLRQTDPGTGERGVLEKAADSCTTADVRSAYSFTLSGTATALATGTAPRPIGTAGSVRLDANRNMVLVRPVAAPAAFTMQSDCMVEFVLPALSTTGNAVHLRGMLVNGGAGILAIETDPGQPAAAVFVAR